MTVDQLSAVSGALVIALGVSETLPLVKSIKANSWGQLFIAVLRAVAAQPRKR